MSTTSNVENLSPQTIRQVMKEMQSMVETPLEGIKIQINAVDVTDIQALIEGPAGTPYAGGMFRVKITLGKDFPQSPPKAFFITKIFHPNVAANGAICVNTLKKDWKPDLGIKHILLTIKCLLTAPNGESGLNEEAGKLLLESYDDYSQRAKTMMEIHAQPTKRKRANDVEEDFLKAAIGYLRKRIENSKKDEAQILAGNWAAMYRKLDVTQQLYAKRLIDDTLRQARMGLLTESKVVECANGSSYGG